MAVAFREGDAIGDPLDGFDVLVAGDVFYERPLAEGSLAWFRAAAARGVRVLVGDPGRIYSPSGGLRVVGTYDVPTTLAIEDREVKPTRVLEVVARGA